MSLPWGAIGAIGSSLVGGLFSRSGAGNANQMNALINQQSLEFNSAEAEKARMFSAQQAQQAMDYTTHSQIAQFGLAREMRDWQEEMSNTSYQRAIADMQQAGLNPMLAYSQGGAGTPPGGGSGSSHAGAMGASSAASAGHMIASQNEYAGVPGAISSAMGAAATVANLDRMEAETAKIRQETKTEENETARRHYTIRHEIEKIYETMARGDLNAAQERQVKETLESFKDIKAAEAFIKKLEMLVAEATSARDINEAIAEAKAWATEYGQEWRPYVKDASAGGTAGAGAALLLDRTLRMMRGRVPPARGGLLPRGGAPRLRPPGGSGRAYSPAPSSSRSRFDPDHGWYD